MERTLERILEELLVELRAVKNSAALPTVLTKRRAALELSVSLSKLKGLIRAGEIMVCEVGSTTMVPASEIRRLAQSARAQASNSSSSRPAHTRASRKPTSPAEEARQVRDALRKRGR